MLKHYFLIQDVYEDVLRDYHLFDFSKDSMYGFLHQKNIIVPNESSIVNYKTNISNLDFAVNDLINLEKEIQIESINGRFPNSSFINYKNFIVKKGYTNPIRSYEQYVIFYYLQTFKNITQENKFYSFESFFDFFLKVYSKDFLVFSDYVKSKYTDIFSSGLAFQIFEQPTTIDTFILDTYYRNYYNLCKRHNFNIDKYRPWIIVRRVDDTFLSNNSFKYNYVYDLDTIITFSSLLRAYRNYVSTNIVDSQELRIVNISTNNMKRDKFLRFYVDCKLKYKNMQLTTEQFDILVNFLKNNLAATNSIRDSLYKLDNIKRHDDPIYQNWEQIFS